MLYLCDIRQADDVGDEADNSNEDLPAFPEKMWELIHQRSDESLHCAELRTTRNNVDAKLC